MPTALLLLSLRSSLRPSLRLIVAVALALCAVSRPARAQQPTDDLEALLGESVVTTASRSAERASVAPATVFTITAAEMMTSGVRTVDEALEFAGLGIYTARPRDYSTGIDVGAQGMMLRDGGRHVLVMLDGAILNSQGTGRISIHEALGVPLEAIDHIEVMLGPGSVMYGSNAMLAVINVVTRRAKDLQGAIATGEVGTAPAQDDHGNPTSGAGTRPGLRYRLSAGGGTRFKLAGRDGEATAVAEWTHDDSASYGVTPFTTAEAGNQSLLPGQTSWGGNAHHEMRAASAVATVKLGDLRLMVNGFDYHRTMPLVGTFNQGANEAQSGVRADLGHALVLTPQLSLDSRLYAGYARFAETSDYGESFWCIAGQDQGCHLTSSARSGWVGLAPQLVADWRLDGTLVTTLGYDGRARAFDSDPATYRDLMTDQLSDGVPTPHASSLTYINALFAQQVWHPRSWLAFNAGARLDIDSLFGARASPRAAIIASSEAGTVLRLSYNEAFRAPSAYELSEFDPTYRITPHNLRPETVRSAEAELQQRIARLSLSLRGYAAYYTDFIESRTATDAEVSRFADRLSPTVDPAQVVVNDNLTSLRVVGGSLAAQLRLPCGLVAAGTLDLARTTNPDGSRYMRMPPWFGNVRIGWQPSEAGTSIVLSGVYASSRVVMASFAPTADRIGERLDLRLTAAGPFGGARGLSWRATVGFDLNHELPYAIAVGSDTPTGYSLYPDQPRLFGSVGLRYQFAGM